ncbi:MAG: Tetratricopeptide repeat protein [Methanosaeta sp. PtaU1.Bin112]|nr:MAG: Tetratricopeptide repeat protein [Methanosaeta sp. PtaU1.Bin112]
MNTTRIALFILLFSGLSCGQQTAEDWSHKGNAQYEQAMYEEAIQSYEEAIRLAPQYAEAWYNKRAALEALEHDNEASAALSKARELGYVDSLPLS